MSTARASNNLGQSHASIQAGEEGSGNNRISGLADFNTSEKLAFVVNIPIGIIEINKKKDVDATITKIHHIQEAYLKGYTPSDHPPFKMVFCVNCQKKNQDLLDEVMRKWSDDQGNQIEDIAIVPYVWEGNAFPYGTIRNALLHSPATQGYVDSFVKAGYYPYVAIGDADVGNRMVLMNGEPLHIFKALENKLNRSLNTPSSEGTPSPLSHSSKNIKKMSPTSDSLHSMSISRTAESAIRRSEVEDRLDIHSSSPSSPAESHLHHPGSPFYLRPYLIGGGYRPFVKSATHSQEESLKADMDIRSQLARTINPLAPYFPEPNLFIDGTITGKLHFGEKGAEFNHLRKEVARLIQADLEKIYQGENEDNAIAHLKNNRHPDRNIAVGTFFDLAIETETDRLFKKIKDSGQSINSNLVAQHHGGTTTAMAGYLDRRYDPNRNGGSVFKETKQFLETFRGNMPKLLGLYHELIYRCKAKESSYKPDLLDQSYLACRTKDNEILHLAEKLADSAQAINKLDKAGHTNRTAEPMVTVEYTALDILNTAVATVYGNSINILLNKYWQDEQEMIGKTSLNRSNTSYSQSDDIKNDLAEALAGDDEAKGFISVPALHDQSASSINQPVQLENTAPHEDAVAVNTFIHRLSR